MKQALIHVIDSNDPSEHPQLAALYEDEGFLHICCWVTATFTMADYGVPGSPVWQEIDEVEIDEVEINGEMYTMEHVDSCWGENVSQLVHASCMDAADKHDW